ncbi:MAG: hypothetical protein ACT4OO_12145 [Nitrospiraceae bacterium]
MSVLIALIGWQIASHVLAQTIGEEAEMERLRVKAEDAIANDDPEGAAMSMGRAALMASELAKRQSDTGRKQFYQGAEALFRSQEHAYRGLALFRRAGGQPPASSGVCGSMQYADNGVQQAIAILTSISGIEQSFAPRLTRLQGIADDWVTVIGSMQTEFQCM